MLLYHLINHSLNCFTSFFFSCVNSLVSKMEIDLKLLNYFLQIAVEAVEAVVMEGVVMEAVVMEAVAMEAVVMAAMVGVGTLIAGEVMADMVDTLDMVGILHIHLPQLPQ